MDYALLKSLLFNVTLIITYLYVVGRIKPFDRRFPSKCVDTLYISSNIAILAILCMMFPIIQNDSFMFDLRSTPIVILGMTRGFIPSIIAGIISGFYRFLIGGRSVYSGIIFGTIVPAFIGSIFYYINCRSSNKISMIDALSPGSMTLMGLILWLKDNITFGFFIERGQASLDELNIYLLITNIISFIIMGSVIRDNIIVSQHSHRLKEEAVTDALTKLKNYRYIVSKVFGLIDNIKDGIISIMMVDIDDFKAYNDAYGHMEGDNVLRRVSGILKQSVRDSDIVARYGGEEFLVVLNNVDLEGAHRIAERIRNNVSRLNHNAETNLKKSVTVSIGISGYPAHGDDMHDLINKADIALYKAKELGKNNVQIYHNPSISRQK